jgi:hypothetical protein
VVVVCICVMRRRPGDPCGGRPALPGVAQPVNEPRLWGSAARAGERRWARWRRLAAALLAAAFRLAAAICLAVLPTVLDPIGGSGVVAPGPAPPAPVVVSVPPPLPLALEGQLEVVIVLVSRFTAPVRASSRPWIVAAVLAVMVAEAMIVPTKRVPVPSVAEEPTCQNTLQACAPLMSTTLVFEPVISVEPI